MSELQIQQAEELITRLTKKEKRMDNLFYVLIGSIIIMAGSISALTHSSIQNKKDIESVRMQAFNRDAAVKLVETFNARSKAVEALIENENTREAIRYFDEQIRKITDDIVSWNSEIRPRGASTSSTNSSGQ